MFCQTCGNANAPTAKFCTNCGQPLAQTVSAPAAPSASAPANEPLITGTIPAVGDDPYKPAGMSHAEYAYANLPPVRTSGPSRGALIGIIAGVLVVAGVLAATGITLANNARNAASSSSEDYSSDTLDYSTDPGDSSSGSVVDWSNDTASYLSAGQTAKLEFDTYEDNADQTEITDVSCY